MNNVNGQGIACRHEMVGAQLELGNCRIDLSDYATTGLRCVMIGPSGGGKTFASLLVAEQLSEQGWVSVLVDPEGVLAPLYGGAVRDPEHLRSLLAERTQKILVIEAKSADDFVPYGQALIEVVDTQRKPVFLVLDEGQLFSTTGNRVGGEHEASMLIRDYLDRGRKRKLDLCISALRYTASLNRAAFDSRNLTLVAHHGDSRAWAGVAPVVSHAGFSFADVSALQTGQFLVVSRHGVEKATLPMPKAVRGLVPPTKRTRTALPGSFREWDAAVGAIDDKALAQLTPDLVALMSALAGLAAAQARSGADALADEILARG